MTNTIADAIRNSNSSRQFIFCYRTRIIPGLKDKPELMEAIIEDVEARRLRLEWLVGKGEMPLPRGAIAKFAKKHGIDPTYLSQLLNKHRRFGEKAARKMETDVGLPDHWFDTTDIGEAYTPEELARARRSQSTKGRLPLITWAEAAHWSAIIPDFKPEDAEEWLGCPVPHSSSSYVLRVKGPSMHVAGDENSFPPNHLIFVDPAREPKDKDFVIARMPGEEEASFRQLAVEGGKRYLIALNPGWPNRITEMPHDAEIVGVVVFSGRQWG